MMIQAKTITKLDLMRKSRESQLRKLNSILNIVKSRNAILENVNASKVEDSEPKIRFLDLKVDLRFNIQVKVWIDCFEGSEREKDCFQCLFLLEPDIVTNGFREAAEKIDRFDAVFAHDSRILRALPRHKVYLFEHGGTWIVPEKFQKSGSLRRKLKSKGVSFVCGGKRLTRGHRLRHEIWKRQEAIDASHRMFYISGAFGDGVPRLPGTRVLDAKPEAKFELFDDKSVSFHVCIENVRQENYFSEKLLDCFLTRTIPIYWGCPNIDSYFDVRGMILIGNEEGDVATDAIQKINTAISIPPEKLYLDMHIAIEENFRRAKRWINLEERMQIAIERALYVRGY